MNSISLLPPSIKSLNSKSYKDRLLLIFIIILIIAALISNVIMIIYIKTTNSELKDLREEREIIEAYIDANKDVISLQEEIIQLEGLMEKGMGKVPDWSQFLIELADCRPKGVINHIVKGKHEDPITTVTINGFTDSQQSLKNYMGGINTLTNVFEVKLNYLRQAISEDDMGENYMKLEFEIWIYLNQESDYNDG